MARRPPDTPYWAIEMLNSFSPGELQAGAFIDKPRKQRNGEIVLVSQRNRGTGIPASTWSRMRDGLIQPGHKTLVKLARFKERYQYNMLRASGAPKGQAKKFSRSELSTAMKLASQYRQSAVDVARALSITQERPIDPLWILYNMTKGEKTVENWDQYVTALAA